MPELRIWNQILRELTAMAGRPPGWHCRVNGDINYGEGGITRVADALYVALRDNRGMNPATSADDWQVLYA